MLKDLKVRVVVPSNGPWCDKTALCMTGLVADASRAFEGYNPQRTAVSIFGTHGSILPQLRERALMKAIKDKATHLLFIDSDMTFPPDTLRRLLNRQRAIVAANCATKCLPSNPTARAKGETLAGEPLYTFEKSTGIQRVWRVGTGVMLITLAAIEHLPQPFFNITWVEELKDHRGEDWFFCEKLEEAQIPIYVDHDLSKEIGHIGSQVYDYELVELGVLQKEMANAAV